MTGSSADRPHGTPNGRTEQANELAEFVRDLTSGITVRALAEHYHVSGTTWAEYRSGQQLIPLELLERLVADQTPDGPGRRLRLAAAVRLHRAAEQAAELTGEQASERTGEQAAEQAAERPGERDTDAADRSGSSIREPASAFSLRPFVLSTDRSEVRRWSPDSRSWQRVGGPAQHLTVAYATRA